MMIVDAISCAPSSHAVYFLVTAYLESLHQYHRSLGIPAEVIALPLAGVVDLEARLTALRHNINVPLEAVVPASEVSAVLGSAVQRLEAGDYAPREKR
jgi:hypothetical protein